MGAMNDKSDQNSEDSIENASEVIERFGGIRPMANKMNVPVTTVQGWKKRDVIPANRRDQVIEAAAENDIDVSDLVAGAANENAAASDDQADDTYELAMNAVYEGAEAAKPAAKAQKSTNEEAVLSAKRRAAAAVEPPTSNEELIGQIRKAQSMAVTRSAWFSVALVAGVVGVSAMLLWPTKQQVTQNGQNIALLQGEMQDVKKGQGLLRGLIPDDIEARFSEMQEQTRDIQDRVSQLSTQAQSVARDVMDPNASVGEKLERLGAHAQELGAPSQLNSLLAKIREMEQSAQGQAQLSSAVAQLNALLGGAQSGEESDFEAALQQAQQQDDALGQTLQGVSPQDLKAATLLLGLSQLRSSLNRSAPFEEDLALMEKTLGTDDPELQAAIARLAPKAKSGVLTTEGLKGEFKGLAGDIVVASLKGEDVSVQEKARARLNNLIQVEKDGELITGTDTQATVARAQKQLEAGDVQAAITTLQSLDGEAASAAQPFINDAELTLVAQQLQGLLTQKVIKRIGGGDMSAVNSGGMGQLINEIKKMAPQRAVVREEESGFIMLEPKPKYAP